MSYIEIGPSELGPGIMATAPAHVLGVIGGHPHDSAMETGLPIPESALEAALPFFICFPPNRLAVDDE